MKYRCRYVEKFPYVLRAEDSPVKLYFADPDAEIGDWSTRQWNAQHYTRDEAHRAARRFGCIVVHIVPKKKPR